MKKIKKPLWNNKEPKHQGSKMLCINFYRKGIFKCTYLTVIFKIILLSSETQNMNTILSFLLYNNCNNIEYFTGRRTKYMYIVYGQSQISLLWLLDLYFKKISDFSCFVFKI